MKGSLGWLACIYLVCCSQASTQTPARSHSLIELRAVRDRSAAGYSVKKSVDDTGLYLADRPVVSDDDIADASTDTSAANGLVLRMRLTPGRGISTQQIHAASHWRTAGRSSEWRAEWCTARNQRSRVEPSGDGPPYEPGCSSPICGCGECAVAFQPVIGQVRALSNTRLKLAARA